MPNPPLRVKDRIVECATELFMEKGYRPTTLNDILEKADIARGTFYHHFDSKDDLLYTVAERIKRRYLDLIRTEAEDKDKDVLQRLRHIDEGINALAETEWIRKEIRRSDVDPSLTLNVLRSSVEEALPYYAAMVEEGARQGVLRTPHPGTASMLMPMLNLMSLHLEQSDIERLDHFRRLMLEAVDMNGH